MLQIREIGRSVNKSAGLRTIKKLLRCDSLVSRD